MFTDSDEWPSFADVTADFVYARLMRARGEDRRPATREAELHAWAERARTWATGGEPDDLPRLDRRRRRRRTQRDVFVFFINADKERNPAAATTLIELLQPATTKKKARA